jgi:hypothetical protein
VPTENGRTNGETTKETMLWRIEKTGAYTTTVFVRILLWSHCNMLLFYVISIVEMYVLTAHCKDWCRNVTWYLS